MAKRSKKKQAQTASEGSEISVPRQVAVMVESDTATDVYRRSSEEEDMLPTRAKDVALIERSIDRRIVSLIEGPVGCGKTALMQQISLKHGKQETFCIIQMGEQVDSKGLFGMYHCTDIPGEFVWRPSVLAKAVTEGHWVLLEDIDCAPAEVLGALMPLIELRRINLPGRDALVAHDDFRLFVTVRTSRSGQRMGLGEKAVCLDKLWLRIRLQAFTDRELRRVISNGHPRLSVVSKRLVDTFARVVQCSAEFDRPSRFLGTRDLLKWCNRLASRCESDDATGIFQEAVDVMAAFAPTEAMRKSLMQSIASQLSVSLEQVDYYASKHRPTVKISEAMAVFGRVSLRRMMGDAQTFSNERFALTRPVCQLLERLAMCVHMNEAILLSGETGCGKTAAVQFIAKHTGRKLHVVNMSQQSESSDLLGGHKPVSMQTVMEPIRHAYLQLFEQCYSKDKNTKFLKHVQTCFVNGRWPELVQLMLQTARRACANHSPKTDEWRRLIVQLRRFERVVAHPDALPFAFVQGVLMQAATRGEWILLDEINLASAETLNCLCTLLDGGEHIYLQNEGGENLRVHADFRLIACMNPATDVGKKDLPVGVRNRFTEIFVDEVDCKEDLLVLVQSYLQGLTLSANILTNLVELYVALRLRSSSLTADAWGHHPHYSLRTFCRALSYASENPYGNELRSLYEAFCMSFLTEVDDKSRAIVQGIIQNFILGKNMQTTKTILSQPVPPPAGRESVRVEGYWIEKGDEMPASEEHYVITATVKKNMRDVARVLASRQYPVLLEGETSAGKTSLIRHMARLTGNTVVRINNHEHTDLQEYIGSYAADADQRLVFVEGPLIEAMRKGYWVILDELNLAPPDVLEALNRLLDDNRELFITETNTTVRAHPRFVLLATQNPAGLYGGRKRLSRAFVNRFVQLRFGELPSEELQTILHTRCALPTTYAQRMVAVMHDLQVYRSTAGVFAGKESYMTLRDLFRWGERYRKCTTQGRDGLFDWDQFLADQGFFLLGGRCRRSADEQVVKDILLKHLKRPIDYRRVFGRDSPYLTLDVATDSPGFEHIVWTDNSLRMAVLAGQSWLYDEPALLVGETGCGKTSLCELLSNADRKSLLSINCHLMTEAADFLGRLRPATLERQRDTGALFEWTEGPLVSSMRRGCPILIDEISLAADSVLERLNSVLEPERQLLLTETGDHAETLTANRGFQLIATMNPGGDYGKKELSKALRNRFTEIWCSADYSTTDLLDIVKKNAMNGGKLNEHLILGPVIVDFAQWFMTNYSGIMRCAFTIRDILAWTHFFNQTRQHLASMDARLAVLHGACVTLLDSLSDSSSSSPGAQSVRDACIVYLCSNMSLSADDFAVELHVSTVGGRFGIAPFSIEMGPLSPVTPTSYSFQAPTCQQNLYRLLRALSIRKPILMEGSPGAGKSSLVVALAKASGHRLVRLNLSDQTDLSDLFGSDLPTTNANGDQTFAWNDGPLLKAMKQGDWVLLDEMNLASQSVLEGLNACLDHRGSVFIPELGRSFVIGDKGTRFFACQNPFKQGGNRRGLPKSFVNRFTVVYTNSMTAKDELVILTEVYGERIAEEHLRLMVEFNERLNVSIGKKHQFGDMGGPWEFNLRDLLRWADLVAQSRSKHPGAAFDALYRSRMRTTTDKEKMTELFAEVFGERPSSDAPSLWLASKVVRIGRVELSRHTKLSPSVESQQIDARLLRSSLRQLERLATCVHMNWLAIVVGHAAVGKSTLVRTLADLCGQSLNTFHLTSDTDALELLGSFEQTSGATDLDKAKTDCIGVLHGELASFLPAVQSVADLPELRAVMETAVDACSDSDSKQKVLATIERLNDNRLRFEWVNSPFLDAFINGHWLLVENVNCCSAAVLDRLNSALEQNGELTLSEKGADINGQIASYTAHPNFRVFFTMNPRHGAISRAMRNRAVEICLLEEDGWTTSDQDVFDVAASLGVSDIASAKQLKTLFDATKLDGSCVLSPYSLIEGAFVTVDSQLSCSLLGPIFGGPIDQLPPKLEINCHLTAPSIVELVANPSATQLRWLSEAWALSGTEQSSTLGALFFAILSATAADVSKRTDILLEKMEQNFPEEMAVGLSNLAKSVSTALKESLPKNRRNIPFDSRFNAFVDFGRNPSDAIENHQIADSVIQLCMQRVFACLIAFVSTEKDSATFFSDRFLKKRIGEESLPSPALKYLPVFTTAVREKLLSSELRGSIPLTTAMIVGMWDLLLFMQAVNEKLKAQTSTAPAQLAWQMMQSTFLSSHTGSADLSRAIGLISKEWSVDERAEVEFLEAYKRLTVARPYSSLEAVESVATVNSRVDELSKRKSSESDRKQFWQHLVNGSFADVLSENVDTPVEHSAGRSSVIEPALAVARQLSCALVANTPITEQLVDYLLRMQLTVPSSLILAKTVDWAQFGDIALRLSWFNSNECVHFLNGRDRQLKNVHLLWLPAISEMVSAVWSPLRFNSSLARLPLSEIGVFSQQVQQLSAVVWSAGIDFLNLAKTLRHEISVYVRSLIDGAIVNGNTATLLANSLKIDNSDHLFATLISLGLALLKQTTPPRRMLDPVVRARERRLLLERKLTMINDQLETVNRYFLVTTGASLETHRDGRMVDHPHPVLRALWTERSAIKERLEENSLDIVGFRPTHFSFDRLTTEMASFSVMTEEALGVPMDDRPFKSRADVGLITDAAKLRAWSLSADRFLKMLTVEFSGYPDITMPYLMALNCTLAGVHGSAALLDAEMVCRTKRIDLGVSSISLLDPSADEWSDEFVNWALHETSPIPNKLQLLVAMRALTNQLSNTSAVDWVKRTWASWHTSNVAKREKMFEYRSRAKNAAGDLMDDDEIEMIAQFPDFSQSEHEEDQQKLLMETDANLRSDDVCAVLDVVAGKSTTCPSTYTVSVWLMNELRGAHGLIEADSPLFADHLRGLRVLATSTHEKPTAVNVYTDNDPAQLMECCKLVGQLRKASVHVSEQWPEVGALKDIQSECDSVLAMSSAAPMMRLAAKLESLLTECSNWESVAHRGISLETWLAPLRALLVDWRKMEVRCWEALIDTVDVETQHAALLASYPLIESCDKLVAAETTEINLTAVLIEWLHNSTLGDFRGRLEAAELCAFWVTARSNNTKLAARLRSVRAYFAQFATVIEDKLAALRSPLQKELKEFVKVVKYQDLNLWSVKLSAQKAHQQLFKIVKRYKQVVQEPIRPLLDQLLPLPSHLSRIEDLQPVCFDNISDHARLKRLSEISTELCNTLNADAAPDALLQLTDLVKETEKELNTATKYVGTDEEKEKQQGRAHTKRQKAIAKLLRATKSCGISYRKGLRLDAEQQLQTLLTLVHFEHAPDAEAVVRLSTALRTVVMGCLEKPNKQIGPQIAVSMRGISELVPDILLQTTSRIDLLAPSVDRMAALSSAISHAIVDSKDSAVDGRPSDQSIVRSSLDTLSSLFSQVEKSLVDWSTIWQCAPTTADGLPWKELTELLPSDRLRIADLRRNEPAWLTMSEKLSAALIIAQQLSTETNAIRAQGTFAGDVVFWKRSILQTYADVTIGRMSTLLEDVDCLLQLCTNADNAANPFSRALLAARRDLLEAVVAENRLRESWSDRKRGRLSADDNTAQSTVDRLLLTAQKLHVALMGDDQLHSTEDATTWLTKVVDGVSACGIEQSNDALTAFYQSLIDIRCADEFLPGVQAVAEAARNVSRLVVFLVDMVKGVLRSFAKTFHAMAAVFVKIAKDGYVDPIPKADESGADGKGKESFEDKQNAGMGEGQGIKDVTDEIEDLGQIEGLKGDNENECEEPPPDDPNSEQKPIDMDDDFAANLEDINLDQNEQENSDSGSDGDEEEEPKPDWQMGDAEDNQEDQLDPNLWDKEDDKTEQQSNDDGNKGAQDKQDELGAKDEERADEQDGGQSNLEAADEQDGEDDGKQDEQEEEGEDEGMENVDLRDDAPMNEDEDSGGEDAVNTEEGPQDEENEDGENEESAADAVPDEDNQEGQVNETDAKVEDTAETTAAAASETGLGHSEMDEQTAADASHEQPTPSQQQQMEQQAHGDGDVERDTQAQTGTDDSTVQWSNETRDNRPNPHKRPHTEQRERKTLGDKSKQFERSHVEHMETNESSRPEGAVKSDRYAHEPNIGAEREEQQVVDAATLEEAKEGAVQMDQLDDGADDEPSVADGEAKEDRDADHQPSTATSKEEIKSAVDDVEAMDSEQNGQAEMGPIQPVSDQSTIHTVLDFYQHASTALCDAQMDVALFTASADRNNDDLDSHRRHWNRLSATTNALAAELTENLRLILEPTQASKLEGDYRTGKRLNMRRLIPYIASNFRKDKIWLRRTKKAAREYQILIAVDDSSSMADNKTRELTLESVSLLEAALRHLEAGRLGVCKFGESIELLHGFEDHFGDDCGARVVSRLSFQQTKTDICQLLSFATGYFGRQPVSMGSDLPAQLLVIVSDGRGLFADGMDKAKRAVQAVNAARVFVVFVVVDNPEHKDSIVDIKVPVFGATGELQILSYMDFFPFPFYVILKRISALPAVIGDALRQWFEIVANRQ